MNNQIKNIISQIYKIFSKYPENRKIQASTSNEELIKWNNQIFSKPLKELTQDELSNFVSKTMTTYGELSDFKHFLPRILELISEYKAPYDLEILFSKLEYGNWKKWKNDEKKIIENYMLELWKQILNDEIIDAEDEFDDYFFSISKYYYDFRTLLNIWEETLKKSESSIKHLANFVIGNRYCLFYESDKYNRYVERISKEKKEILKKWILSDKLKKLINTNSVKNEKLYISLSECEKILNYERNK